MFVIFLIWRKLLFYFLIIEYIFITLNVRGKLKYMRVKSNNTKFDFINLN